MKLKGFQESIAQIEVLKIGINEFFMRWLLCDCQSHMISLF